MRNSHVMLLAVLGLLLARQGTKGLECYSCNDCPTVGSSTAKESCSASCMATITCQDSGTHFVNRLCSLTNKNEGCAKSTTSKDTYNCYCNEDDCDALASNPDICDSAPVSTVASLGLVFVALLSAFLFG